ncbi:MAG TPA: sulfite exporter TauE/SafE family protein, partial [Pseudomonadota bacterium]|nr:sulfite exporter TauE/SafE family protein [Pseudomonadota bacterium]
MRASSTLRPRDLMFLGVPASELLLLAALIGLAGLVTGILAGLFGIGGGALIVPVLYEAFGAIGVADAVRFQLCVGTSLAIIVPTNVLSFRVHRDRGAVMMDIVRASWVPAMAGVAVGSAIAAFAPAAVLKIAFVLVAGVLAAKLLLGRESWKLADALPGRGGVIGYGFTVGLCSSLMGISGGSISNMILTLHAIPMHKAVATSAALGVPITIAGTIGYLLAGLP